MNTTRKTSSFDKFLNIVVIITIVLLLFNQVLKLNTKITLVCMWTILMIIPLATSINSHSIDGTIKSKRTIQWLTVKSSLIIIATFCFYEIVFTKNYNLKYTYWVGLITTYISLIIFLLESIKSKYEERKLLGKKHNKLYFYCNLIIYIGLIHLCGFILVQSYILPQKKLVLDNFKVPNRIIIYKYNDDKYYANFFEEMIDKEAEINDSNEINKIITELKSLTVKNLTSTNLANYERMKHDSNPYYKIVFGYDNVKSEDRNLENGYINTINMSSSKNITISELKYRKGSFISNPFSNEVYPISFSKEIIEKIFTYKNNNN